MWRRVMVGVVLVLAGCGDDDGRTSLADVTTTTEAAIEVDVRVVAEKRGMGCTWGHSGGNGAQVTISDESGERLGIGELRLTHEERGCDWSTLLTVEPGRHLYVITVGGSEIGAVTEGELAEMVWVHLTPRGDRLTNPYEDAFN